MNLIKLIGKVMKYATYILSFVFIVYLMSIIITSATNDYNIFKKGDQEVTVTKKMTQKSLFRKPIYLVKVDMNEHASGGNNEIVNRIPSWQFKHLEVGDSIKGHNIDNERFFTTMDVMTDILVMILLFVFLLFIFIILFMAFLNSILNLHWLETLKKDKKNKRKKKSKERKIGWMRTRMEARFGEFTFFEISFLCLFIIATVFFNSFIINTVQKIIPFGKTETVATVIDKESELAILYYLDYNVDPSFNLILEYPDEDGKIYETTKEVSKKVYENVIVNSQVDISYLNRDPYNIFVQSNLIDIFYYWRYVELFVYVAYVLLGGIYLWITISKFKKRWLSRRKT